MHNRWSVLDWKLYQLYLTPTFRRRSLTILSAEILVEVFIGEAVIKLESVNDRNMSAS